MVLQFNLTMANRSLTESKLNFQFLLREASGVLTYVDVFFRWHSYMFWSLANNHNVSDGLKGVTYTQAIIIISYQHITIHSKSKKVCGTAFQ